MARWLSKKDLRERRKLVGHLKDKKGLTLSQVVERLGITLSTVSCDYRKAKEQGMIKHPPLGEEEK